MRLLSVLVLAIFMMGPGLRAECLTLCLKGEQPALPSACHNDAGGDASIGTHHDCATVAPALVTAVKRPGANSVVSLAAAIQLVHVVGRNSRAGDVWHGPPRSLTAPPLQTPLRI